MQATSTAPVLPVELLLSIFGHLRRHDLAQVCKANSYLRHLARPLFYRFGTFTKFGLHFPGAPSPYSFLNLPEIDNGLEDSELGAIVSKIKELRILPHDPSECAIFRSLQLEQRASTVEVLRIDCYVRIIGDTDEEHLTGDLPRTTSWPATDDDDESDCHHCKYPCLFMKSVLLSLQANKVVLRNPPQGVRDDASDRCLSPFKPVREFIAVLNSEPISEALGHVEDCSFVNWGIRPFWCAQVVTIVLWTGSRDEDWLPACQCARHYCFEPDVTPMVPGPDGKRMGRYCESMKTFWRFTGFDIGEFGTRCALLRIVNAIATVESFRYGKLGQSFENRRVRDVAAIEECIREGATMAHELKKKRGEDTVLWNEVVEFLSMEEWAALGEWEDVFTRREMEPFLARDLAHVVNPPAEA